MPGGAPALVFNHVDFRYDGRRDAPFRLESIDFRVDAGEIVALMGPNGSGKTTVIRLAAGAARPIRGHLAFPATPGGVGYIPQQLGLVRNRTVRDNVLLGALGRVPRFASILGRFPPETLVEADEWIRRVGLEALRDERVHHLSGGQRQRVAIARALLARPGLLLADELVSNLDAATATDVLRLLRDEFAARRVAVLLTLHDVGLARAVADRILFMSQGRIIDERPAHDVSDEVVRRNLA